MNRLRILIVGISLMIGLVVDAKHLQFMGIPIDGSISTFQSKLAAKGCKLAKFNNELPVGIRAFIGQFAGHECDIFVGFDAKTKQVYQVDVIKECDSSPESARAVFDHYKNLLSKKYELVSITSEPAYILSVDDKCYEMSIFDSEEIMDSKSIGDISINIVQEEDYPYNYFVCISYVDAENKETFDKDLLKDV